MKYNTSIIDIQKHSYLTKMQEQEVSYNNRVQFYQKRIGELTQEVRNMKDVVKGEGKKNLEGENQLKEYIGQLEGRVQLLNYQNQRLREDNQRKSQII